MTILAEAIRQFPATEALIRQSYRNLQWSKGYFSVLHKGITTQIENFVYNSPETLSISPELAAKLQQRVADLLEQDWADAQAGYYPVDLLFDEAWQDFLQFYPQVCADLPAVWARSHRQNYQDFSSDIPQADYPEYYVQNFHHQTDGYLSESSANLYDIQVELVFGGKADAMRRRIIAPLTRSLQRNFETLSSSQLQLLDLGCGTGRTLLQLRAAFPDAQLFGLDLSSAYLQKANRDWTDRPGTAPQFVAANGESCPYADETFHGISNVFMLHELPAQARQNVLSECYRLLKPGGILVICDSIQYHDSPDFGPMMLNFSTLFHEPYYENYIQDNLIERLSNTGFEQIHSEVHFLSKYLIAQKPKATLG